MFQGLILWSLKDACFGACAVGAVAVAVGAVAVDVAVAAAVVVLVVVGGRCLVFPTDSFYGLAMQMVMVNELFIFSRAINWQEARCYDQFAWSLKDLLSAEIEDLLKIL